MLKRSAMRGCPLFSAFVGFVPGFPGAHSQGGRWMKSTTTWRGQTEGGRRAGYNCPRQSGKFASHCIAADSLRSPLNLSTGITDTHAVA